MPFLETVRRSIKQHHLLAAGDRVVVGVSGGADSLALMHALHQLRDTLAIHLHVATLDHGWRGEQSAGDAQFVEAQAQRLGLPVTRRTLSLKNVEGSLEGVSRRVRYDFFADVADDVGARIVATAHHADDQAETILMRLIRGAGLQGLAGMGWRVPLPYHRQKALIRPLLGVTREQIETYCAHEGLMPRHDPTNDDVSFLRNRLRHETIPALQALNPAIEDVLVRLGDMASVTLDYMAAQTETWLRAHASLQGGRWQLDQAAFQGAHPALQRQAIVELVARVSYVSISYERVLTAQTVGMQGAHGAVVQFAGGVRMRVGYGVLVFERVEVRDRPLLYLEVGHNLTFEVGQTTQLDEYLLTFSKFVPDDFQVLGVVYLPAHVRRLTLRTRQPGDRIAPPGLDGHTQKLSHWMINQKIPALHRDCVPLVVIDGQILAVLHVERGIVMHPYHLPRRGCQKFYCAYIRYKL